MSQHTYVLENDEIGNQTECTCGCGRRLVITQTPIGQRWYVTLQPGQTLEQHLAEHQREAR